MVVMVDEEYFLVEIIQNKRNIISIININYNNLTLALRQTHTNTKHQQTNTQTELLKTHQKYK